MSVSVRLAVRRVAVQADEDVGAPLVRLVRHGGVPALKMAALPSEIVALHEEDLDADKLQIELHALADVGGDVALSETKFRIDGAAVVQTVVPWIQKYTHLSHSFSHGIFRGFYPAKVSSCVSRAYMQQKRRIYLPPLQKFLDLFFVYNMQYSPIYSSLLASAEGHVIAYRKSRPMKAFSLS